MSNLVPHRVSSNRLKRQKKKKKIALNIRFDCYVIVALFPLSLSEATGWIVFVFRAYPAKWKATVIWIQLLWFENSNKLCIVWSSFSLRERKPLALGKSDDISSACWFYCPTNLLPHPSLSSPPTQCLANSHIAGIMKLMFYGPLLSDDKMTEGKKKKRGERKRWTGSMSRWREGKKKKEQTIQCLVLFFWEQFVARFSKRLRSWVMCAASSFVKSLYWFLETFPPFHICPPFFLHPRPVFTF